MNVFGHHYLAKDHPSVTLPHLFEHFDEQVAAARAGKQGLPMIATEGKEVQVVSTLTALPAPRHNRKAKVAIASAL